MEKYFPTRYIELNREAGGRASGHVFAAPGSIKASGWLGGGGGGTAVELSGVVVY